MKKNKVVLGLCVVILLASCATGGGGADGLSLTEAVEQSARQIAEELPAGTRVAIVAFETGSGNLSDFIMDELTGVLFNNKIEIAERRSLEYVEKELDFQMSGRVNDDTAKSIAKFVGAEVIIVGQLRDLGGKYRFTVSAIHVEKGTPVSAPRFDVRNDREMKSMVAALDKEPAAPQTAAQWASGNTTPQTAGNFLDRGIMFAMRGEYQAAIQDFSEAIRLNAKMTGAYMLRGRALAASASNIKDMGDNFGSVTIIVETASSEQIRILNQAIEDFTQAINLDPNNAAAYWERGRAYRQMGDNDKAMADYIQAIRINPKHARAYNSRGTAYLDKRDYDRAIEDFTQAIRIDPNLDIAYNNRGIAYRNKNDYDRAIEDYTQAIRINPNYEDTYNNRGNAYRNKNDYDRAIADYTQAIRIDPNYAMAYRNRGLTYLDKNDYDRAIADYEASLRIDPNNATAKQRLEEARRLRGR